MRDCSAENVILMEVSVFWVLFQNTVLGALPLSKELVSLLLVIVRLYLCLSEGDWFDRSIMSNRTTVLAGMSNLHWINLAGINPGYIGECIIIKTPLSSTTSRPPTMADGKSSFPSTSNTASEK